MGLDKPPSRSCYFFLAGLDESTLTLHPFLGRQVSFSTILPGIGPLVALLPQETPGAPGTANRPLSGVDPQVFRFIEQDLVFVSFQGRPPPGGEGMSG